MPSRWVTYKLENNNTKEFSHHCEDSEPHVRLPSLGIRQRDWESPGNLALKASGICLQDFHRTGGNRSCSLGGHKHSCAHQDPEERSRTPQETEQRHQLASKSLLWVWRLAGAQHRDEVLAAAGGAGPLGVNPLGSPSWKSPLTLPTEPVEPRAK